MNEREPAVNWFFVHDGKPQGSGYFVGYERVSNRLVGFIGLAGSRSHSVPAGERIPVRGEQIMNYWILELGAACDQLSGPNVDDPTGSLGRPAAAGPCALGKPPAGRRPRRADGSDRLRSRRSRSFHWEFPLVEPIPAAISSTNNPSW